jgi:hypothetical protein
MTQNMGSSAFVGRLRMAGCNRCGWLQAPEGGISFGYDHSA